MEERDIVMSSAGGISKGSYQAGVDWTISEYLRRQRDPAFRQNIARLARDAGYPVWALPHFALRSVTGASAGNINALFAAIGWCTRRERDESGLINAEDSLFWKTWVNTGTPQLLPPGNNPEPAALSRVFILDRHMASIREFLARAEPIANCELPVGVTLTKVVPEVVTIGNRQGSIGVQRFASILAVRATDANPWVDFGWPEDTEKRGSYGALALLPHLRNTARDKREERLRDVFDVLLASSAFPVAFAPRQLCFEPGGLLPQQPGEPPRCEPFSDGGVFDNNPIGLAVRLLETQRERRPTDTTAIDVAYSSPGNFRGELKIARREVDRPSVKTGLGAAVQLLTGAIAAARDYELQSLRRQIERDAERDTALHPEAGKELLAARPWLMLSSRRTPIVGESLYSFGAFLGRPFREYDFYTGVYDGLEFVARHFVCPRGDTLQRVPVADSCTAAVHSRLVGQNAMHLSSVARAVIGWHRDEEYPTPLALREPEGKTSIHSTEDSDRNRLVLLRVIHRSLGSRLSDDACKNVHGTIESLLCPGGLDAVLTALLDNKAQPEDPRTPAEAADWLLDHCERERPRARGGANVALPSGLPLEAHGECTVDSSFRALMKRPKHDVNALFQRAIRNVERGERNERNDGGRALDFPAKVAYSLVRSSTMRYRDGLFGRVDINRSSAVLAKDNVRAFAASAVGLLGPNYIHDIVINQQRDQAALGWQPVAYAPGNWIFFNSQAELFLTDLGAKKLFSKDVVENIGWGASVGTFALRRIPLVGKPTSIEAGLFRLPKSFPRDLAPGHRVALRFSSRLIADKVAITFLATSKLRSVSIGISDLNGIAYWILR